MVVREDGLARRDVSDAGARSARALGVVVLPLDEVRGTVVVPTLRASEELVRTVVCCSRARPDRMRGGLLRLLCVTDVVG